MRFFKIDLSLTNPKVYMQAYLHEDYSGRYSTLWQKTVRPAVLLCPGGSYYHHSPQEAEPLVWPLMSAGFNVFILYYSVARNSLGLKPFMDISKAMLHIKKNASLYKIDKERIACMGFSAGGNLIGMLGNHWHNKALLSTLNCEAEDLKPLAEVFCYALFNNLGLEEVSSTFHRLYNLESKRFKKAEEKLINPQLKAKFKSKLKHGLMNLKNKLHNGEFDFLQRDLASDSVDFKSTFFKNEEKVSKNAADFNELKLEDFCLQDNQQAALDSIYKQTQLFFKIKFGHSLIEFPKPMDLIRGMNYKTPPSFIWHTSEDAVVPAVQALAAAQKMQALGIKYELHLYQRGRHGDSLMNKETNLNGDNPAGTAGWINLAITWLKENMDIK